MNTLLSHLVVLAVAGLLAGPALYGLLLERRVDRQLRAAREREGAGRETRQRPRPGPPEIREAHPVGGGAAKSYGRAGKGTQKSSSRSTVPSTAT
ncbi:hypothetical protein [Streptomyces sp. NPDC055005]